MRKLASSCALTASLLLVCTAQAQAPMELRYNTWLPATHNVNVVSQEWAKEVEAATQGRVKVTFSASALGTPQRNFDLAKDGVADLSVAIHGFTPARFVLTRFVELPFVGNSGEALSVAFWKVYTNLPVDEHKGAKLLSLFTLSPGVIWTKTPIETASDLKGMKFRVGGGLATEVAKTLGIVIVGASAVKSYELHSTGIVDGTFLPRGSIRQYNIGKFVPHGTQVPGQIYNESWFFIMNEGKWNSISPADQKAITQLSGEKYARSQGKAWDRNDSVGDSYLKENDVTVKVASDRLLKDLRTALSPMEREWIASARKLGVDGEAALKSLRAEAAKVGQ
jgi:TRAP-type C4-dicarboxylate transport system substrate-binding protein